MAILDFTAKNSAWVKWKVNTKLLKKPTHFHKTNLRWQHLPLGLPRRIVRQPECTPLCQASGRHSSSPHAGFSHQWSLNQRKSPFLSPSQSWWGYDFKVLNSINRKTTTQKYQRSLVCLLCISMNPNHPWLILVVLYIQINQLKPEMSIQ